MCGESIKMPRVFASYAEVEKIVETVMKIHNACGEIPEELINAIKESLKHSYKGCIIHFYRLIAEKCPEALKYF
jgi:uncharacterized protein (UPF0218 family)